MKTISALSKIAFICNICFLLFLIFQFLENQGAGIDFDKYAFTAFIKNTLIILGFMAVFLNFVLTIIYIILLSGGKDVAYFKKLPLWNMLFLAFQIFVYFIF